jgi:hypothetical protein
MEPDDKRLWESVGAKANEQIDRRDDLIEQLFRGEISPNRAVTEAKQLGLPPLYGDADPSIFDPMGEMFWTPLMAVAWIAFRDVDLVRRSADEYRSTCTHLVPLGKGRYLIETVPPASRRTLDIRLAARRLPKETIEWAIASLLAALTEGRIEASGLSSPNSERATINRLQWIDLRLFGYDVPDRVDGWYKVRLSRDHIVTHWPEDHQAPLEMTSGPTGQRASPRGGGSCSGRAPAKTRTKAWLDCSLWSA